jgi:hypothetical protein
MDDQNFNLTTLGETVVSVVHGYSVTGMVDRVLSNVVDLLKECRRVEEEGAVRRHAIDAWQRVELEKIRSDREMIEKVMTRTFDERAENFKQLFRVIDQAMESNSHEQLTLGLEAFVRVAQANPLRDLADLSKIRAGLNGDKNIKFQF